MIPAPRPGPRFGDCPDCGRQHDGECHLAEMERNREVESVDVSPLIDRLTREALGRWCWLCECFHEPVEGKH